MGSFILLDVPLSKEILLDHCSAYRVVEVLVLLESCDCNLTIDSLQTPEPGCSVSAINCLFGARQLTMVSQTSFFQFCLVVRSQGRQHSHRQLSGPPGNTDWRLLCSHFWKVHKLRP